MRYVSPYHEKQISHFSENAYLYLMALLFLLFVSPMSSISYNAESISHALLLILDVFALLVLLLITMIDWSIMNAMALGSSSLAPSIIAATLGLQYGGGIYTFYSTITMTNCEISGNTAIDVRFTIS